MKLPTTIILLLILTLITFSIDAAERGNLTVERSVSEKVELAFPNDNNIQPNTSDFLVLNYILLSSESGERWATVTLKNNSTGNRIFVSEQVMGLFANGARKSPLSKELRFEGKERQTFTLNFGKNKFPILQVYSRNR